MIFPRMRGLIQFNYVYVKSIFEGHIQVSLGDGVVNVDAS